MQVSIFGSFRPSHDSIEYRTAYQVAYQLASIGYTIVNGGGSGIMEATSVGARDAGGKSIGVLIKNRETITSFNDEIIRCDSLFKRLRELTMNSDAWIVFAGGTGTLAELSIIWDLVNKGSITKRPLIIYGDFWKPLLELLSREPSYKSGGFCTDLITVVHSAKEIVTAVVD